MTLQQFRPLDDEEKLSKIYFWKKEYAKHSDSGWKWKKAQADNDRSLTFLLIKHPLTSFRICMCS